MATKTLPHYLTSIPASAPLDKLVLVIGGSNVPSLSDLKSFIQKLNRIGNWIKFEFSEHPSPNLISLNVGLVLTHTRCSGDSAQAIRTRAKERGVMCPLPVTNGDLKALLQAIWDRRSAESRRLAETVPVGTVVTSPASSNSNGNGNGTSNGHDHDHEEEVPPFATESSREVTPTPAPISLGHDRATMEPTSERVKEDAVHIIDRFRALSDQVGMAVLEIRDECALLRRRNDELERELADSNEVARIAQDQLADCESLRRAIETERDEARNKLAQLEQTFKGVFDRK